MKKYQYEEALEILLENTTPKDMNPDRLDSLDHAEMVLKELVDKATPKKHIVEHCPTCGESVRLLVTEINKANQTLFYEVSHCWNCGQAIDWSENE